MVLWPWPLTHNLEIQQSSRGCRGTRLYIISSSSAQRFMSYRVQNLFALFRNRKKTQIIRSCDLDLWPITLKFNRVRADVEGHAQAKFHRAMCSGSWVILGTEKKLKTKTQPSAVATADSNKKAQLTQRESATAVHVWRPTANKCKIRKNLYFSAQGHSRSLLSVSIETHVW